MNAGVEIREDAEGGHAMTEAEWKSAPLADLLLHTLDIHRARHGAEPSDSALLRPPHAALRCDMGRKHMLLAFAVVRRYWSRLVPAARRTIVAWEAIEEGERERDRRARTFRRGHRANGRDRLRDLHRRGEHRVGEQIPLLVEMLNQRREFGQSSIERVGALRRVAE